MSVKQKYEEIAVAHFVNLRNKLLRCQIWGGSVDLFYLEAV